MTWRGARLPLPKKMAVRLTFKLALLASAVPAFAAVDVDALWNYADPAASEQRFRLALAKAQGADAAVLRTQIARSFSLRKQFDEAHQVLDELEPQLAAAGVEARVRALLERGRTWRSAKQAQRAQPLFHQAFEAADAAQLQVLAADALHMLALAAPSLDERVQWNQRTVTYARSAADPKARYWAAVAMNNLGSDLREANRLAESLAAFEEALLAYEAAGRAATVRVARWQVANVMRLLGRHDEALALQLALERDNDAAATPDRYVYDELALLSAARGDTARAQHYRSLRQAMETQTP